MSSFIYIYLAHRKQTIYRCICSSLYNVMFLGQCTKPAPFFTRFNVTTVQKQPFTFSEIPSYFYKIRWDQSTISAVNIFYKIRLYHFSRSALSLYTRSPLNIHETSALIRSAVKAFSAFSSVYRLQQTYPYYFIGNTITFSTVRSRSANENITRSTLFSRSAVNARDQPWMSCKISPCYSTRSALNSFRYQLWSHSRDKPWSLYIQYKIHNTDHFRWSAVITTYWMRWNLRS